MKTIAYWDWRTEPLPDAGVVVCAPGLFSAYAHADDASGGATTALDSPILATTEVIARGSWLVVPDTNMREFGSSSSRFIPALHVERQADLALPAAGD